MTDDRFDLERFVMAQAAVFDTMLEELKAAHIGCGLSFPNFVGSAILPQPNSME